MKTSKSGSLVIFSDEAPDEDAFGTHQKIADVLAEYITNSDQGHAIGLQGGWGSGKSAVLSFLSKLLERENPKKCQSHRLFVFDAWAHEGDELRRSFLDELNTFIHGKGPPAEELRETIWQEKEKIRTDRKTTVPARAIFFALSIALVPVYGALLNFVDLGFFGEDPTGWIILIFLLICVPFVLIFVGVLIVGCLIIKQNLNRQDAFIQVFNFLHTKDASHTTDITRTPSSSYREFRDSLKRIVKTGTKGPRKLIIAIDNIDRLDGEKAKLFWSSLAPFFDRAASEEKRESNAGDGTLSRIWLIIPFSKEHLAQMFDEEEEVRDGFIEKTFDLILEVPPPALSSWQKFLADLLVKAFPELESNDDELSRIVRLYDLSNGKSPTPRHLKQFVNRITITRAQLVEPDKIPLRAIASFILYILGSDSSSSSGTKNYELLPDVKDTLNWADHHKIFAAIQFGVPLKDAPQAYMLDRLKVAIQKDEKVVLKDFSKVVGFESVLTTAISHYVPLFEGATVAPTCIAIKSLSEAKLDNVPKSIWVHLGRAFARSINWNECVDDWQTITSIIIDQLTEKERGLFQAEVRTKLKEISSETWPKDQDMIEVADAWHEVAKLVSPAGEKIQLPIGGRLSVCVLAHYADINTDLADFPYILQDSPSPLLTEENVANLGSEQVIGVAKILADHDPSALAHIPVNQLISEFKSETTFSAEQVVAKLSLLLSSALFSESKDTIEGIKFLFETGALHHHTWSETSDETLVAALAATLVSNPQNEEPQQNYVQAAIGFARVNSVIADPKRHLPIVKVLGRIFGLSETAGLLLNRAALHEQIRQLAIAILEQLLDQNETVSFTVDDITLDTSFWKQLEDGLAVDEQGGIRRLLAKCRKKSDFLDAAIQEGFQPEQAFIYGHLIDLAKKINHTKFLDFVAEGLKNVEESRWLQELACPLDNYDSLVFLAKSLKENRDSFQLGIQVRDAIDQAASGIAKGSRDFNDLVSDTISGLIKFLPESEREGTEKSVLREMLHNPDGKVFQGFSELFDLPNFSEQIIYSKSEEFMDTLDQFAKEKAYEGLASIKKLLDQFPKLYSKAPQNTRSRIRDRLLGTENAENEEISALISAIINTLKIKRPKKKED